MTRVAVVRGDQSFTGEVTASDKINNPAGGLQDRLTVKRDDTGTLEYVLPETADQVTQIDVPQPVPVAPGLPAVPGAPPVVPGLEHLAPSLAPPPGAVPSDPSVSVVGSMPAMPTPGSAPVVGPAVGGGMGHAPPVGSSIGGVPMAPPVGVQAPVLPTGPAPLGPGIRPKPERFMVQPKKGKPTVFHTRQDCSKVPADAKQLEVDDDKIEFFELEVCASCQRRDSQISWREAIEEAVNALPGSATPGMVMAPADVIAEAAVAALQSNGFRVTPDVVER